MLETIKSKIRGTMNLKQLKKDGMVVGEDVHIMNDVSIDTSHCWLIEIGDHVTIAPGCLILAHDASTKRALGYTRIGNVHIGNNVFVGARTVILPNVKIGNHVVIGAGSIVTKDLPDNGVYAGNPCRKIMDYDQWIKVKKEELSQAKTYTEEYIIGNITDEMKLQMKKELELGMGFIV